MSLVGGTVCVDPGESLLRQPVPEAAPLLFFLAKNQLMLPEARVGVGLVGEAGSQTSKIAQGYLT